MHQGQPKGGCDVVDPSSTVSCSKWERQARGIIVVERDKSRTSYNKGYRSEVEGSGVHSGLHYHRVAPWKQVSDDRYLFFRPGFGVI